MSFEYPILIINCINKTKKNEFIVLYNFFFKEINKIIKKKYLTIGLMRWTSKQVDQTSWAETVYMNR